MLIGKVLDGIDIPRGLLLRSHHLLRANFCEVCLLLTSKQFCNIGLDLNVDSANTVSYTHLDVYKRQGQTSHHRTIVKTRLTDYVCNHTDQLHIYQRITFNRLPIFSNKHAAERCV